MSAENQHLPVNRCRCAYPICRAFKNWCSTCTLTITKIMFFKRFWWQHYVFVSAVNQKMKIENNNCTEQATKARKQTSHDLQRLVYWTEFWSLSCCQVRDLAAEWESNQVRFLCNFQLSMTDALSSFSGLSDNLSKKLISHYQTCISFELKVWRKSHQQTLDKKILEILKQTYDWLWVLITHRLHKCQFRFTQFYCVLSSLHCYFTGYW